MEADAIIGALAISASSSLALAHVHVACSAQPFTGKTETGLNDYIDSTWNNFVVLPHYDEKIHWDVHLLYKNLFGHYSMLFVTPGHIEGFCIHLIVNEDNKTEFRLDVVNLRSLPPKCPDLKALSLGTTEAFTAKLIITKAHDRLINMGSYHALLNNCQDYCNKLAADMQVSSICELWSDELNTILQGIASVTTTGAVAIGTAVESTRCLLQTGSRFQIKSIKDLYDEYFATTNQTKKDV